MERAASHRVIGGLQRANARRLRASMTDAEVRLWKRLRGHRFADVQFRRQVPIGPYIVDFCCHAARLAIEVDGGQHGEEARRRRDAQRDAFLAGEGYRVLRFWNSEVLGETGAVLDAVWAALTESGVCSADTATPLPLPPPQGGRERRSRAPVIIPGAAPPARTEGDGTTSPPVPSPLVGEGQGGGCAAPPQVSETMVSRANRNTPVSETDAINQGPIP